MRTNAERAERAFRALQHDYLKDDKDNAVRDFLSDLRHYCDEQAIDFEYENGVATRNYYSEVGAYDSSDTVR